MIKKIHLPGLNGVRAIAAIVVLVFHIDQFLGLFNLKTLGFHKSGMAGYGVLLFFVLSGYLITYLLLLEKANYQKIDLPKFYMRRILRIWPIYYTIIIVAALIYFSNSQLIHSPENKVLETFLLYSLLLSNIGYGLGLGLITITPLWSVGVEEQFYAFWPFLINKSKNILRSLIIITITYLIIKILFRFIENGVIYNIINLTCFDCMAIGGVGAFFVYTKHRYLTLLYHPILQIIAWSILLVSVIYKPLHIFSVIDTELNAFFYLIIIINVSSNKHTIINLENRLFDFIGKISYGIYVFHLTIIYAISYFMKNIINYNFSNSSIDYVIVFLSSILTTIFIAFFSYKYFESYFLKLKLKFSKIISSNTIKN